VVFVFAGLAKINADWLLDAQPLRIWLAVRGHPDRRTEAGRSD
jgi:hypothetical protein